MATPSTPRSSPLFHLSWVLGLVVVALLVWDIVVGGEFVPSIVGWLVVVPVVAIVAGVVWRGHRPTGVVVAALAPAVLVLLYLLVLLGFAGG